MPKQQAWNALLISCIIVLALYSRASSQSQSPKPKPPSALHQAIASQLKNQHFHFFWNSNIQYKVLEVGQEYLLYESTEGDSPSTSLMPFTQIASIERNLETGEIKICRISDPDYNMQLAVREILEAIKQKRN